MLMDSVVIHGDDIDVQAIQEAIRQRVAQRTGAGLPVAADEIDDAARARIEPLADWNFPVHVWDAMWPPRLSPWNLEEPYPIESHRDGAALQSEF